MRCQNCNRFVSEDMADPEVDSIDIEDETVRATVRVGRNCAECGETLKEATVDIEWTVPADAAKALGEHLAKHEPEHGDPECEGDFEVAETNVEATEAGSGRKRQYGVTVEFDITCSSDPTFALSGQMEGSIPASDLEEV